MHKRIIAIIAALILSLSLSATILETVYATEAPKLIATAPVKKKRPPKKNKYYMPNAIKMPFSQKFEFKKSMVRKTFQGTKDGKIMVVFENTRLSSDYDCKLYVRVFYRHANNKKWVGTTSQSSMINGKPGEYGFQFTIPKNRPFYVQVLKKDKDLKDYSISGRLTIRE